MVVIGPHYRDEEVAHRVAEPSRPERQKRAEGREFRGPQFQHQHSYENGEHPVRESVQPLRSPPRIWHGPPFSPVLFRITSVNSTSSSSRQWPARSRPVNLPGQNGPP